MKLNDFLANYAACRPARFHMPGHKGRRFFERLGYAGVLDDLASKDITEVFGADDLHHPSPGGIIRSVMDDYKSLYGSRETFLLVNGSTCGLEAAVMTAVKVRKICQAERGEIPDPSPKVLAARNCHRAVLHGIQLAGAEAEWIRPEVRTDLAVSGEIRPAAVRQALENCPDAAAVVITSPNYYGILSDIPEISRIVHEKGAWLIVDQAHGAHLRFLPGAPPLSADLSGADIVIESTHKTLASFTQTAVANIYTPEEECPDLTGIFQDMLDITESSSPSYPLLLSLELNAEILRERGTALMREWRENLDWFYEEARKIPGFQIWTDPLLDDSKIVIKRCGSGFMDGALLDRELRKRGVVSELVSGPIVLMMTGIGNDRADYERLAEALRSIDARMSACGFEDLREGEPDGGGLILPPGIPERAEIPLRTVKIPLEEACGRVSAKEVVPYPPGIPVLCPGEIFCEETVKFLVEALGQGREVHGVTEDGCVIAGA